MVRKTEGSSSPARGRQAQVEGVVRVGPLMGLATLVRDLGFDPNPLFAGEGFNPAQFLNPDVEIPFVAGSKLLARCATATGCGHLGLLLGKRSGPSSLGVAGFMLQTAPDVGTALRGLVRHLELHDRADELHADQQKSFGSEIRRVLRTSLTVQKKTATDVAKQLGMHERTLNRRLREEGTTFRRELADIRYEVARQLLADTTMPLSKIAAAIGYADSTAFIRAFKRWSELPPAEWRRLQARP